MLVLLAESSAVVTDVVPEVLAATSEDTAGSRTATRAV